MKLESPTPHIQVARVTDSMADALADFFRAVWDPAATGDDVRRSQHAAAARNPLTPGQDAPAIAYLRDGTVIGYIATIPAKFWNGTADVPAYWLKGFMVLPEYRNGPVGFTVLKELLKHLDVSGIMTVAPAARRLFGAVGYKDCGTLPNYLAVLRPGRVAQRLDIAALGLGVPKAALPVVTFAQRTGLAWVGGALGGVALSGVRALRAPRGGLRVVRDGALPPRDALDDLWRRARGTFVSGAVRDGTWLSWRYEPRRGNTYEAVSVFAADGPLAAVALVRRPKETSDARLRGIRVATLSDILFSANDVAAGCAVVAAAERVAADMGADALLCSASHPAIERVLRSRVFVRLSGNVHLLIRDPKSVAGLASGAGDWWVTRGDASSDEVF